MNEYIRPKSQCVSEIKSYNGKLLTNERLEDLEILKAELGSDYEVKQWTFNKHIRISVIKDGMQL